MDDLAGPVFVAVAATVFHAIRSWLWYRGEEPRVEAEGVCGLCRHGLCAECLVAAEGASCCCGESAKPRSRMAQVREDHEFRQMLQVAGEMGSALARAEVAQMRKDAAFWRDIADEATRAEEAARARVARAYAVPPMIMKP